MRAFLLCCFLVGLWTAEDFPGTWTPVVEGFKRPVWVGALPGSSGRLVVVEQHQGEVRIVDPVQGTIEPAPFLRLPEISKDNEQGLLGLAFHPHFVDNGQVFVYATVSGGGAAGQAVILRYRVAGNPRTATAVDPASKTLILAIDQPQTNHNGGWIAFGPEGLLYLGVGDGGAGNDQGAGHGPIGNAQNRSSLLGKLLRLDVDHGDPYAIPSTNMVVNGKPSLLLAFGLRNPWRCAFDPMTHDLWIGDVGQNKREEINLMPAGSVGLNFGWRPREGTIATPAHAKETPVTPATEPVMDLSRDEARSVIGGLVYRGAAMPSLRGTYLFTDWATRRWWALRQKDGRLTAHAEVTSAIQTERRPGSVSSLGEDAAGELYACDHSGGKLWKLTPRRSGQNSPVIAWEPLARLPASGPQDAPATLGATGVFRDLANLEPAAGFTPYQLNVPFWSDGARKRRWLGLPAKGTIDFAVKDAWTFPVGTVAVKHFDWVPDERHPAQLRRLETRLLVRNAQGVYGLTYRWNESQTEAEAIRTATTTELTILNPTGAPRRQTWLFPGPTDCLQCHTVAAGYFLGPNTRQFNRTVEGVNQLSAWAKAGRFAGPIPDPARLPHLPDINDASISLEARARAWLDSNCASCHRPGGAPSTFDARWDTPLAAQRIVNTKPANNVGIENARLVAPGDPRRSLVWWRVQSTVPGERMPPLGHHTVDEAGAKLLSDWILTLKP